MTDQLSTPTSNDPRPPSADGEATRSTAPTPPAQRMRHDGPSDVRDAGTGTPASGAGESSTMMTALSSLGAIVGPTTFLTALLYFFGWNHAHWFFLCFGVDSSIFGFSTADYLVRSQDALFGPIFGLACIVLLCVWLERALRRLLFPRLRPRQLLVVARTSTAIGALLSVPVLLVAAKVRPQPLSPWFPLLLAIGTVLVLYGTRLGRANAEESAHLTRPQRLVESAAALLIIGSSIFWSAANLSAQVGTQRALAVANTLEQRPSVSLFSEGSLGLSERGVTVSRCQSEDPTYKYRYEGLRLITQSGDQYFLLPTEWRQDRTAIIVPKNDTIRLEYRPAGVSPSSIRC